MPSVARDADVKWAQVASEKIAPGFLEWLEENTDYVYIVGDEDNAAKQLIPALLEARRAEVQHIAVYLDLTIEQMEKLNVRAAELRRMAQEIRDGK